MLIVIKEPTAIKVWAAAGALEETRLCEEVFQTSLTSMARHLDAHPPVMEWKQLSKQGVCRFLGSVKTINAFRVARLLNKKNDKKEKKAKNKKKVNNKKTKKTPCRIAGRENEAPTQKRWRICGKKPCRIAARREEPPQKKRRQILSFGLTERQYALDSLDLTIASPFLRVCGELAMDWKACLEEVDLLRAIEQMNAIILKIAQRSPRVLSTLLKNGYVRKSIVRKSGIGLLQFGKATIDWDTVTVGDLGQMFPDQGNHLKDFPPVWSAAHLSRFLFDRPDWPIFASCFACLWHDVSGSYDAELVMAAARSGRLERLARELRKITGHGCAPCWIVECLNLT